MDILSIFTTGLFAGGLTCLAVQGGLLASSIAQLEEDKLKNELEQTGHVVSIFSFLVSRLLAYTLLGLVLGAVGAIFQISLEGRAILQVTVSIFMIGTALNLLQVHPLFRYFILQPPKFLTRIVKNQSRSKSVFGPALLGAFTVFIPCGATQAMMAYAMTTGSAFTGGVTMFAFILGTSPLFFLLGYAARKIGERLTSSFNKIAAMAIILIAMYNINGALALLGSDIILGSTKSFSQETSVSSEVVSDVTIYLTGAGYTTKPKAVTVKSGSTVKLKLVNQDGAGCVQAFTIPKLGVQKTIPVGSSDEITIEIPQMTGQLAFMCSMGMFRGAINVI